MPRRTLGPRPAASSLRVRGYHPLWPAFPGRSAGSKRCLNGGPEPRLKAGLGSSAFARRYSRNRLNLSFPPGTEMFQFPGCRPARTESAGPRRRAGGVAPFGDRWIEARFQLPTAYRR